MKQPAPRSKDFDGHTEFARLTPEQRLMWLSQAAQFVIAARQARPADTYEAKPKAVEAVREISSSYPLTNPEIRKLKAEAQHLEPVVRVGKSGLTPAVLYSIRQALDSRSLIKIRFDHDREERDVFAGKIAEETGATLIMQVGKVAVFYRPKPANV